jgi:predicted naringenin-chalcone synthase
MSFHLAGLATAVPLEMVTQEDAARLAVELRGPESAHTATIPALYRRAGVRTRHCVVLSTSTNGQPAQQSFYPVAADAADRGPTTAARMRRYEADAVELAVEAARGALDEAAWDPDRVSHLVTVSCSGFSAPGVDIRLIERLDLPADVSRTHVGFMGCHGALNGLRVAAALAAATPGAGVLVCCVELCSLHQQYTSNAQQVVANALFSDGAAAVVGTADSFSEDAWRIVDQRSCLLPHTSDLMSWRIGDHGFEMTLSPRVPEVIRTTLRPWLARWLAEHSIAVEDIRGWAIHPGGPRILTACADALDLAPAALEPSQEVLAEFGNMSSPTVLFIVERLRELAHRLPCVVLAFGPGLTIEAALLN